MSTTSRDSLVLGRVVGDVVDPFSPTVALRISYNGRRLINGSDHRPSAVVARPRVEIGGTDFRQSYTLVKCSSTCISLISSFISVKIYSLLDVSACPIVTASCCCFFFFFFLKLSFLAN
jgi:protein FLOWERING LOCUS T